MLETKERIEMLNAVEERRVRQELEKARREDLMPGLRPIPFDEKGGPGPLPPHHKPHNNLISVLYSEERMKASFGQFWGRECENISKEPPEIKIVFALLMGFQVCLNRPLTYEERTEPSVDFVVDLDMARLSALLGLDEEVCAYIIRKAPDGIVTIIKGLLETRK